jgi:hypothetical protein
MQPFNTRCKFLDMVVYRVYLSLYVVDGKEMTLK